MRRAVVGVLAGFGAGAMLSAIAFDLVAEAEALMSWEFSVWMLIGVGSVVDGVAESIIFSIQIATGFPISPPPQSRLRIELPAAGVLLVRSVAG